MENREECLVMKEGNVLIVKWVWSDSSRESKGTARYSVEIFGISSFWDERK